MRKLLLSFLCLWFMLNTASAATLVPMSNGLSVRQLYDNLGKSGKVFRAGGWGGKIANESYPNYSFDSYMIWLTPQKNVIGMSVDENGEKAFIIVRVNRDTGEVIGLKMFFRLDAGKHQGAQMLAMILDSVFGYDYPNYKPIADGVRRFFRSENQVLTQIEPNGKSLCLSRKFTQSKTECIVLVFAVIP